MPTEDLHLLIKVSKLYYEADMTQGEIMEKLHLSRPKISRLLKQARNQGIVKTAVVSPPGTFNDLELELEARFGLKDTFVIEAQQPESQPAVTRDLGNAGGEATLLR